MRVLKLYRDYLVYVCSEKFFPDGNEKHSLYPRINFFCTIGEAIIPITFSPYIILVI